MNNKPTTTKPGMRVLALCVVILLGLSAFTMAQARSWFEREIIVDRMAGKIADSLELDTTQETAVQDILEAGFKRMEERRDAAMATATAAITADTLTAAQAGELIAMREQMQAARHEEIATVMAEVHAILTPTQRTELAEIVAEIGMDGRHMGMRGRWGRDGHGHGHHGKRGHRDGRHGWLWDHDDDDDDDHHDDDDH
jgi:Spy/CpxP family protein refolding chaperone